ncbi:hypothetical protein ABZX98_31705 [Streptomyces sp. NPDC002992]|uniref:hypothetical protein n=1 Tax=Streptomyces sp. NPDC002992 TaxID=3154273 RepID=UPI00339F7C23
MSTHQVAPTGSPSAEGSTQTSAIPASQTQTAADEGRFEIDDHLGSDDPETIEPIVRQLIDVLDRDDADLVHSTDPFIPAFAHPPR